MFKDILALNLQILFCGTAVGDESYEQKAYYFDARNKFWAILYKIGLTSKQLNPEEYETITNYNIGLTDLVKDKHGVDSDLSSSDYNCGRLTDLVKNYSPKIVCFNGKRAAQEYLKSKNIQYGFQDQMILNAKIFVAPSTSGNAAKYWDEEWWYLLANATKPNFKKIAYDNYYSPDEVSKLFGKISPRTGLVEKISEEDLINAIEDIQLHYIIPWEIKNMFEVAKALYVYGYLYYPFCTLASDQGLRTLEAFISHKYKICGGVETTKKGMEPTFAAKINFLYKEKQLSDEQYSELNIDRRLRNVALHSKHQRIIGFNCDYIRGLADLINGIWSYDKL